ncbi:glycosyltransferase [Sanguibacter suarezii]|uniref:glycosyltransferase n=1 Tax=Sanguibacter suarezii TaxID=60921 RepID=UPI0008297451|nr:glycosyltransferase [Sanguibacter suarezii]
MRIVHLINSLATGGAENLVVNLVSAMRERGHDVSIVTIGPEGGVPADTADGRGLVVRTLGRSARDPSVIVSLRSALAAADVVHAHLFPALYLGGLSRPGTVSVYTEHSTWNRRRTRKVFRCLDRIAYRRYDSVVAISDGVRRSLEQYFAELAVNSSVEMIPNGIDDTFFVDAEPAYRTAGRSVRLIAVGTLDDRKNFADAVAAVAAVPGVQLTIVGDGVLRPALEAQVMELGVEDRVTLLGRRSDVKAQILAHDALIATSRFEGFSLVAAEALALGRPVIGPAIPGFSESVLHGRTGLLYDPEDEVSVVKQIQLLDSDHALYDRLAAAAASDAQRFRISSSAEAYLALYEELLGLRR